MISDIWNFRLVKGVVIDFGYLEFSVGEGSSDLLLGCGVRYENNGMLCH